MHGPEFWSPDAGIQRITRPRHDQGSLSQPSLSQRHPTLWHHMLRIMGRIRCALSKGSAPVGAFTGCTEVPLGIGDDGQGLDNCNLARSSDRDTCRVSQDEPWPFRPWLALLCPGRPAVTKALATTRPFLIGNICTLLTPAYVMFRALSG